MICWLALRLGAQMLTRALGEEARSLLQGCGSSLLLSGRRQQQMGRKISRLAGRAFSLALPEDEAWQGLQDWTARFPLVPHTQGVALDVEGAGIHACTRGRGFPCTHQLCSAVSQEKPETAT